MSPTLSARRHLACWLAACCLAAALPVVAPAGAVEIDFDAVMADRVESWRAAGMPDELLEQVGAGAEVFRDTCAVCHGHLGEGGAGYANPIVDTRGLDKFRTGHRLFLYNRDMMPFNEPGTLPPETVWNVSAWLMAMNGWLDGLDAPLGPDNARDVPIAP